MRRTLDIIFSVGGVALAVLLAVLGLVLKSNADFAKNYVHDQLAAQKITFTPVSMPCSRKRAIARNRASGVGARGSMRRASSRSVVMSEMWTLTRL